MSNGFFLAEAERPPHVKEALCKVVKQEVEEAFGHRIVTSRDCIRLSDEIYSKTSIKVNSNTLRRFFGLVRAQYPPSFSTLNILASYCGYHSLDELSAVKKQKVAEPVTYDEKSILHFLVKFFSVHPVVEPVDETRYKLVKYTIQFLSRSPSLELKFQKVIAKTSPGQAYYFEQFVQLDRLNSYYGEGLRHYLREKKAIGGQIFGYSLLCLKDWLSDDPAGLRLHLDLLTSLSIPKQADPYVFGHYIAAQLLYAHLFELDTQKLLADAYKRHLELKQTANPSCLYKSFGYTVAMALVLTNHYQDALYYINEAACQFYSATDNPLDQKCYIRLRLLKAVALAQGGLIDKAEKDFEHLRPSQFCFLSKKMDTILYLTLACHLNKSNKKLEKQLEDLIADTGFIKLKASWFNSRAYVPVKAICEQK